MSDEELRALERQARAGGSVDVVLRWADALERAGRVEEAVDARLGALAREPEGPARDALCRRPSWSMPGRTSAIDLLPIRRAPVERWRCEPPGVGYYAPGVMGGSPGVVVHVRQAIPPFGSNMTLRDPWTGAVRWTYAGLVHMDGSWARHDALVVRERERVVVRDLRTGNERCQTPAPPGVGVLGVAPGLHVTFTREGSTNQRLTAFRWGDLRRAPEPEPCWRYLASRDLIATHLVPAGPHLLVAGHGPEVVALDRATGKEQWIRRGATPIADDQGLLLMSDDSHEPGEVSMCTIEATTRWHRRGWTSNVALARDVVVGERTGPQGHTFEVVDRASGETRATFSRPAGIRSLIVVGDVIYLLSSRGLEGVSLAGETLWRESRDGLGMRSSALVPLDRHVIVVDDDGGARAFGESAG
jgi:hypothetical protein